MKAEKNNNPYPATTINLTCDKNIRVLYKKNLLLIRKKESVLPAYIWATKSPGLGILRKLVLPPSFLLDSMRTFPRAHGSLILKEKGNYIQELLRPIVFLFCSHPRVTGWNMIQIVSDEAKNMLILPIPGLLYSHFLYNSSLGLGNRISPYRRGRMVPLCTQLPYFLLFPCLTFSYRGSCYYRCIWVHSYQEPMTCLPLYVSCFLPLLELPVLLQL